MHTQSVDDIMALIIQVEKEGADFYRKMAGGVGIKAVKDIFLGLVNDEVQHQADFSTLADAFKGQGVLLHSTIDVMEVFSDVTGRLRQKMKGIEPVNMEDVGFRNALDIGIQNEKSAIMAYSALFAVSTPRLNDLLIKVIDEEKKHLQALMNIKAQRLG